LIQATEKCAGLSPISSCRSGVCGTCASKVSDPSGITHDDEEFVDKEKRKAGWILPCIARVKKAGLEVVINQEDEYILA
jgi:3-ketosteroid 9alpha-monooxygenase subunit B